MIHCFEIQGSLPGLNEIVEANRTNRFIGANQKRSAQDLIGWSIKASHLKPISKKVDVVITWIEPNKRRDHDNIHAGIKFILDALVECGILKGDGWKYVGDIRYHYQVSKDNPRVIIELEELDE